jgi:hypothetical protein
MGDAPGDRPRSPLTELTYARLRELIREPEAVFWVFVFPVLLTLALGIAFRTKGPEAVAVAVASGEGYQARKVLHEVEKLVERWGEVELIDAEISLHSPED